MLYLVLPSAVFPGERFAQHVVIPVYPIDDWVLVGVVDRNRSQQYGLHVSTSRGSPAQKQQRPNVLRCLRKDVSIMDSSSEFGASISLRTKASLCLKQMPGTHSSASAAYRLRRSSTVPS